MKEKINKLNAFLEGFRTVLLAWAGYALMFVDSLFTNLAGLNKEALKGAAAMALLITVKQIKTDVIPKIKAMLENKGEK